MDETHIAFAGDLHFGEKEALAQIHHQDLQIFWSWMIEELKTRKIKTLILTGDIFHKQDAIDSRSLDAVVRMHEELTRAIPTVRYVVGNHDLYYKTTRDVTSLSPFIASGHTITSVTTYDLPRARILLVPWLVQPQEYDALVALSKIQKTDFIFGHFQFRSFKMNDGYTMEHGQSHLALRHIQKIITGHYHTRQIWDNVIYGGSPLPMNYGNSNELDHGFGILDLRDGSVEFVNQTEVYIFSLPCRAVLTEDLSRLSPKTSLRVVIDENLTSEELKAIESKLTQLPLRHTQIKYQLPKQEKTVLEQTMPILGKLASVDETVIRSLEQMAEVPLYRRDILKALYQSVL